MRRYDLSSYNRPVENWSCTTRSSLAGSALQVAMCYLAVLLGLAMAFGAMTPAASAVPPRIFHVRDCGAKAGDHSDSGKAIPHAIQAAIASVGEAEVVVDAGIYRVKPPAPRETCFLIRQVTNLVVRGAGKSTNIIIADRASSGFGFDHCQRVGICDLALDYDPVPFCQGIIRAMDVGAGFFELEVEGGYPTPDAENFLKVLGPYGKWGMIVDPARHRIRAGTIDHYMTPRWEQLRRAGLAFLYGGRALLSEAAAHACGRR